MIDEEANEESLLISSTNSKVQLIIDKARAKKIEALVKEIEARTKEIEAGTKRLDIKAAENSKRLTTKAIIENAIILFPGDIRAQERYIAEKVL